jgi:hypothetical protein
VSVFDEGIGDSPLNLDPFTSFARRYLQIRQMSKTRQSVGSEFLEPSQIAGDFRSALQTNATRHQSVTKARPVGAASVFRETLACRHELTPSAVHVCRIFNYRLLEECESVRLVSTLGVEERHACQS